jgi:hypothetical protein
MVKAFVSNLPRSKKMVYPGTGRHQEERKEPTRNFRGKKRSEVFHLSTHINWKGCKKKENIYIYMPMLFLAGTMHANK